MEHPCLGPAKRCVWQWRGRVFESLIHVFLEHGGKLSVSCADALRSLGFIFEKMACVTWASVVNLAESCRHVFAVDRSPPRASTCPVVGFGGVREHRCENRLARAGFLPGWGRGHPGAPVLRLDQHAS